MKCNILAQSVCHLYPEVLRKFWDSCSQLSMCDATELTAKPLSMWTWSSRGSSLLCVGVCFHCWLRKAKIGLKGKKKKRKCLLDVGQLRKDNQWTEETGETGPQFNCQSLTRVSKQQFGTRLLWNRSPLQFSFSFMSETFAAGIFFFVETKITVASDFSSQWRHQKDCKLISSKLSRFYCADMFRLILFLFFSSHSVFCSSEKGLQPRIWLFFKPSTCEVFVWSRY